MNVLNRLTAAALSLALAASLSAPSALALTPAEPFADFRIDAADMEVPDRTIRISTYRQEEDGAFQYKQDDAYDCKVNRVTGDASLYIQSKAEGVWVTVDYLTDVDGDGLYERLEGGEEPSWDSLTAQGRLTQGGNEALTPGQTYILSAEDLASRFDERETARAQLLGAESSVTSWPLCQITLSRTEPADGQTYEQLYYLEIFGDDLIPWDVPRNAPYREAIEYSLTQGWFSGLEDGRFGPDETLNRAQLAQVLWAVGGSPSADPASFTDVEPGIWYYPAVCWCQQEGLIAGYADGSFLPEASLTREQLVSILARSAKPAGSNLYAADLSRYTDHDEVSSWAYDSMCWALSHRLLVPDGGELRPGSAVTRAELAQALYALRSPQSSRSMW